MNPSSPSNTLPSVRPVNRYGWLEWAGAFGDLGTLMPLVIAYVSVLKLDPFGVRFGFGVSMMAARSGAAVAAAATALRGGMRSMEQLVLEERGSAT